MDYEANARRLIDLRQRALNEGDADKWRDYDKLIQANFAAMRAEVNLGLRISPIFTHSLKEI